MDWAPVARFLWIRCLSDFARKYIPFLRAYLTPGSPWMIAAAFIAIGTLLYYRFTDGGRRSRLVRLLRLRRRYNRFSHEKEMEVLSRIHSQTRAAAIIFLMTSLLVLPLAIAICYLFAAAIIIDITNNVKGTHIHLSFLPKLFFNAYGIALGLSFSWILHLLESARMESLLLSAKYRRKIMVVWQAKIVKLKSKLRKQHPRKALAQSAAASA